MIRAVLRHLLKGACEFFWWGVNLRNELSYVFFSFALVCVCLKSKLIPIFFQDLALNQEGLGGGVFQGSTPESGGPGGGFQGSNPESRGSEGVFQGSSPESGGLGGVFQGSTPESRGLGGVFQGSSPESGGLGGCFRGPALNQGAWLTLCNDNQKGKRLNLIHAEFIFCCIFVSLVG